MSKKSKKEQRVNLLTDDQKIKAIRTLISHGPRGSEWAEASMLHAIEDILWNRWTDVSSHGMEKLFSKIRNDL